MLAVLTELVRYACEVYWRGVRSAYCRRTPSLAVDARLRLPQLSSQMEWLPSELLCWPVRPPCLVGWSRPLFRLLALVLRVLVD